jgi:hypothetical protein
MIKRDHVCEVLKDFTKELYSYPKTTWLDIVFKYLDHVLVCNQHITNTFTAVLRKDMPDFYEHYPKGLFPKFLGDFATKIVKDNVDRINDEIDKIIPAATVTVIDIHSLSKFELLDLRIPYRYIIQILKHIGDPIIERAEYGYYIGSLLHIMTTEYLKKYNADSPVWIEPNWNILDKRVRDFRPGVFSLI